MFARVSMRMPVCFDISFHIWGIQKDEGEHSVWWVPTRKDAQGRMSSVEKGPLVPFVRANTLWFIYCLCLLVGIGRERCFRQGMTNA